TSGPSSRPMNPYPFELLNHFTVPCTSCLLRTVTPGGGNEQTPPRARIARSLSKRDSESIGSRTYMFKNSHISLSKIGLNFTRPAYAFHKLNNIESPQWILRHAFYRYESSVSVHSTGTPAPQSFHPLPAAPFPPSTPPPAK